MYASAQGISQPADGIDNLLALKSVRCYTQGQTSNTLHTHTRTPSFGNVKAMSTITQLYHNAAALRCGRRQQLPKENYNVYSHTSGKDMTTSCWRCDMHQHAANGRVGFVQQKYSRMWTHATPIDLASGWQRGVHANSSTRNMPLQAVLCFMTFRASA
jgi:hypothetical protein